MPKETLNLEPLNAAIAHTPFFNHVHHHPITPSTNTLALEAARAGVPTGVWLADQQTAGRGRGGHTWHSPAFVERHPAGLYTSILIRPHLPAADALKLSLAAGLAAAEAIQQTCNLQIDLRWPNDLMEPFQKSPQKKLGGILTESSIDTASGFLAHAVIGIGINLNQPAFPPELAPLATSLRILTGQPFSREHLLAALLQSLTTQLALLDTELNGTLPRTTPTLATRFERTSTWVRNLPVQVEEEGGYTGHTAGLNPQGLLQIRLPDNTLRTVRHGGVRRA
jgi:BirA family biotin operon repressor/biotin-[acetyl-CoA-carboxylase] ligase